MSTFNKTSSPTKKKPDSPLKTFKPSNTLTAPATEQSTSSSALSEIFDSNSSSLLYKEPSSPGLFSPQKFRRQMDENTNPNSRSQVPGAAVESSSKGTAPELSRTEKSIFNIPKKGTVRPEHHTGAFRKVTPPTQAPSSASSSQAASQQASSLYPDLSRFGGQTQSHASSKWMNPFSIFSDKSDPSYARAAPAQPHGTFSSLGGPGFQPINVPVTKSNPVIDLGTPPKPKKNVDDDDTEFDPDAEIRNEQPKFGAPDTYSYVDPEEANKNLKALLSGAFDEEEEEGEDGVKRRRLPRVVRRKVEEVKSSAKTLAEKLHIIEKTEEEKQREEEAVKKPEDDEEDDGVVDGLKVKLLPHQVDGVAWMIEREVGKKKKGVLPMGGILADDMGLGKTIQSLSLILMNPRPSDDEILADKKSKVSPKSCSTTLVVAPLALIRQWESEIKTKSTSLTVHVHHGSSRTSSTKKLTGYDMVITTYQTVMSEYNSGGGALHGVHWYRVILDEAHTIKNRNAKTTQACYALNSVYRWCLTGTPMQNNLDELQSLIKFLQIKPYCDQAAWKAAITEPMKRGKGWLAMKRLQYFLKACMKRRTKDVLKKEGALGKANVGAPNGESTDGNAAGFKIVGREVKTIEIPFSPAERRFYDKLESRAQSSLAEMMAGEKQDYIGALVLLLRLRQACNHPYLMRFKMEKDKDALSINQSKPQKKDDDELDDLTALLGGLSVKQQKCDVCKSGLTKDEVDQGQVRCRECEADLVDEDVENFQTPAKMNGKDKEKLRSARQRRIVNDSDDEDSGEWLTKDKSAKDGYIGTDDEDNEGGGDWIGDKDSDTEDEDEKSEEENIQNLANSPRFDPRKHTLREGASFPSTKISKLLRILADETPDHKVIVFSQFTSMLDIMEPFLKEAKHKFVRYDGSMRNDAREASLEALRNNSRVRVLLCSLKCGSLGLNLTAASRVVLMEPFWNPFVEEQAIDRVHRLNQTKDVVVYRLTIDGSVEERILILQEAKRKLAAAALDSTGGKGVARLNMADILALFRHDAEHSARNDYDKDGKAFETVRVLGAAGHDSDKAKTAWLLEKRRKDEAARPWDVRRGLNENGAYGRR